MKLINKVICILITLGATQAVATEKNFGKKFEYKKTTTLKELISKNEVNNDKEYNVKAKVVKVCKKKGCWMGLETDDKSVRVTFEDYSFFVPISLKDKDVVLKGKLFEKTISKKLARHYLEDEGKSKEEINKITGDVKEYNFIASGVQVL